jgi:hypothetical protein
MRPLAVTATGGQHATDLSGGEGVGATMRSRAAVGQPGLAVGAVAAKPLVGRGPRDAQGLGGLSWGPAELGDALDQQQPTELGQAGISMGHEGPSRLEASTTQADRGDPQLSTTLLGTTPRQPGGKGRDRTADLAVFSRCQSIQHRTEQSV